MPAQTDGDCATGAREEAAHRSSPGRREQDPGEMPDVPVRMAKTAGPTGPRAGVGAGPGAAAHQGTSWNSHSGRQPAASKKVKRTPPRPWGAPREGRSGSSRPRRQPHPDVPRAALVTARLETDSAKQRAAALTATPATAADRRPPRKRTARVTAGAGLGATRRPGRGPAAWGCGSCRLTRGTQWLRGAGLGGRRDRGTGDSASHAVTQSLLVVLTGPQKSNQIQSCTRCVVYLTPIIWQ